MTMVTSAAKCHLNFRMNFKSVELATLDFPLQVRRGDLSLVRRVLTSQGVDLEEGTYFITANLPSGQEISRSVVVTRPGNPVPSGWDRPEVFKAETGSSQTLDLGLARGQDSPHDFWETTHLLGAWSSTLSFSSRMGMNLLWGTQASASRIGSVLETLGPVDKIDEPPDVAVNDVRWYAGNVLAPALAKRGDLPDFLSPGLSQQVGADPRHPDQLLLMQLLRPKMPPLNVVLPVSPQRPCIITLQRIDGGQSSLDIRLEHPVADLFLRYVQSGHLDEAWTTGDALQAEILLRKKRDDPIAAAVGAYALLRFRREDLLHDWAENLANWFPWLPDGLAIFGEQLARRGEHDKALAQFNQIPSRGLPVFSIGHSYAIDRLRLYLAAGKASKPSSLDPAALKVAEDVLERLQRFAAFAIFQSAFVTYTGLDPIHPDDKPTEG